MTHLTTGQLLSVAIENLVATKNETGHRTLRVAAAAFVYAYDLANNDKRPNAYSLALDAVKVELNKLAETEDGTGAATVKLIRAWVGKAYVKYAPIANAAGNTSDGFDPQAATDAVLAHFGNRSWRVVAGEFRPPQDPNKLPTQRTKTAPVATIAPPAPAPEAAPEAAPGAHDPTDVGNDPAGAYAAILALLPVCDETGLREIVDAAAELLAALVSSHTGAPVEKSA